MSAWHTGVLLGALLLPGCVNVPLERARAHAQGLVAIGNECRASGYAPGSKHYARCVMDNDQAMSAQMREADASAWARGVTAGAEASREAGMPAPPIFGTQCGAMRDGQFSCFGM